MADIVELISQHGKGGQTYNLRRLQGAQADRTMQTMEIERQQSSDQAELRQMKIDQQRSEFGRQTQLDDISRSSETTEEWMRKLKAGGYHLEYQQAQKMANEISKQTLTIDSLKRESAQEEAVFLAQLMTDVESLDDQKIAMEMFDARYPDSDVDEMVDRTIYSPERVAMYRYSALSAAESLKVLRSQGVQERAAERGRLSQERIDISKEKLTLQKGAQTQKQYQQNLKSETGLRKEYNSETAEVAGALNQITLAKEALKQGSPIGDTMAKAVLSKVANSKVRALAELEQYKNFGDLQQRIAGFFSKTLLGTYSNEQRKMAEDALKEIETMYRSMKDESKDYFRYLAFKGKMDSHAVAKYDSPDEIWGNKYLTDEEKVELAKEVFPDKFE